MTNAYADLNTLKSAGVLNITGSSFDARLLALLGDVSRWIDNYCNRHFYVLETTRVFDGGGQELQVPDLISVTTLKTDDDHDRVFETTWSGSDYLLYPLNAQPQQPWGRPYSRVLVDAGAGTKAAFHAGKSTVEIAGKWGFREVVEWSGANINEISGFGPSDTILTSTDGSKFAAGQTVQVESEQLFVSAVTGNDLIVERGANGTAAVSHPDGSAISVYRYPGLVVEACLLLTSRFWSRRSGELASGGRSFGQDVDPDVRRLLSPYRRLSIGVGV